jgi:hypothetical protein
VTVIGVATALQLQLCQTAFEQLRMPGTGVEPPGVRQVQASLWPLVQVAPALMPASALAEAAPGSPAETDSGSLPQAHPRKAAPSHDTRTKVEEKDII